VYISTNKITGERFFHKLPLAASKKEKIMILKNIFLMLFLPVFIFGQKPLKINEEGQLDKRDYQKLIKEKGYDLISMFDTVSYTPLLIYAVTFKDERLGLIDINGNEILRNKYDDIKGLGRTNRIGAEYHDYLLLEQDEKWAIASINGQLITKFEYEGLNFEKSIKVDVRKNKPNARWKIPMKRDSIFKASYDCTDYSCKHIYLNTKGQEVEFYGRAEEEQRERAYKKKHGYYPSRAKDSWMEGNNFNIPKELGRGMLYKNHLFRVTAKRNSKHYYGIYDTLKKELIVPVEYTGIRIAGTLPYFFVSKSGNSFILDSLGNKITELPLKNAYEIGKKGNEAIIARHQNNKLAIFSKSFKPLTEFIFDNISYSNHLILGSKIQNYRLGEFQLIDYEGKEIKFDVGYDKILLKKNEYEDFQESFIYLVKDKKLAIVSEEGKLMSDFDYEEIIPECFVTSGNYSLHEEFNMTANHSNELIFYKKDGKYGIMNNEYEVFLKNEYDMILESNVIGFVYISKKIKTDSSVKTKWGVFDVINKKQIIPIQFDSWIKNTSTFFLVKEKNKYGLFDKYGNEIFPATNEKEIGASYIYKGLYSFEKEYKTPFAFMDSTGRIIKMQEDK
jgi:hypothetical protein